MQAPRRGLKSSVGLHLIKGKTTTTEGRKDGMGSEEMWGKKEVTFKKH